MKFNLIIDTLSVTEKELDAAIGILSSFKTENKSVKEQKPVKEDKPKAEPQAESDNEITVEDVRKLVSSKAKKFRDEIKAKLSEYGANNVTLLDDKHYPDFQEFLTNL